MKFVVGSPKKCKTRIGKRIYEGSVKEELKRRVDTLHNLKQERLVDKAVSKLMRAYEQKKQGILPLE